jgi:tRNA(fMet)-specific endonuclease VapC
MLRNMLDTDFCIRVLRDRPAGLRPRFNAESEKPCISTITLTELLRGAARSAKPVENRQEVERMAARLTILDFNRRAAERAGKLYAELGRKGALIGPYDILIAGHARSLWW